MTTQPNCLSGPTRPWVTSPKENGRWVGFARELGWFRGFGTVNGCHPLRFCGSDYKDDGNNVYISMMTAMTIKVFWYNFHCYHHYHSLCARVFCFSLHCSIWNPLKYLKIHTYCLIGIQGVHYGPHPAGYLREIPTEEGRIPLVPR